MIDEVVAHTGQVHDWVDVEVPQAARRADARPEQDGGAAVRAGRHDHEPGLDELASHQPDAGRPIADELDVCDLGVGADGQVRSWPGRLQMG